MQCKCKFDVAPVPQPQNEWGWVLCRRNTTNLRDLQKWVLPFFDVIFYVNPITNKKVTPPLSAILNPNCNLSVPVCHSSKMSGGEYSAQRHHEFAWPPKMGITIFGPDFSRKSYEMVLPTKKWGRRPLSRCNANANLRVQACHSSKMSGGEYCVGITPRICVTFKNGYYHFLTSFFM